MNGQTILGIFIIVVALVGMVAISAPAAAVPVDITPASATGFLLDKVLEVALGIGLTGIVVGVGSFVFVVARDAWEERKGGNWAPGPNAQFQRKQPKTPQLSSDDLFKFAMLNAMTNGNAAQYLPQLTASQNEEPPPADF